MITHYAKRIATTTNIYRTSDFVELVRLAKKFEQRGYDNFSFNNRHIKELTSLAGSLCRGHYKPCWVCYPWEDMAFAANMLRYTCLYVNTKYNYIFFSELSDPSFLYSHGWHIKGINKDYEKEWLEEWGEFI